MCSLNFLSLRFITYCSSFILGKAILEKAPFIWWKHGLTVFQSSIYLFNFLLELLFLNMFFLQFSVHYQSGNLPFKFLTSLLIEILTFSNVWIRFSFLHDLINFMSVLSFMCSISNFSNDCITVLTCCPCFLLINLKMSYRAYKFIIKRITRRLSHD